MKEGNFTTDCSGREIFLQSNQVENNLNEYNKSMIFVNLRDNGLVLISDLDKQILMMIYKKFESIKCSMTGANIFNLYVYLNLTHAADPMQRIYGVRSIFD